MASDDRNGFEVGVTESMEERLLGRDPVVHVIEDFPLHGAVNRF